MIDFQKLGQEFAKTRAVRRMSLKQVEAETGISTSTLSRLESKYLSMDTNNCAGLCVWMGVPLYSFQTYEHKAVSVASGDTCAAVRRIIEQDGNLPDHRRALLADLFDVSYKALSSKG